MEARDEFGRVKWLSRAETTRLVLVVVVISAAVSIYLSLLDTIFLTIIKKII